MKRQILFLKLAILFFLASIAINAYSQCPPSVTAFIASQTVATCPSNASVTIGSNANGVGTATYQAIVAPSGVSLSPQSSNVFTSLPAGNYTFRVVCGASSANVSTTISSSYSQLTATTATTNVCTSFTRGGTINVSAMGGTTPYAYSILKTTNANYSDGLSSYGPSNILNPTDSGTYQVRIKDNCGNFITKTISIQPSIPNIYLKPDYLDSDQPCGSGNIRLYYFLRDVNGAGLSSADMPYGYRLDLYQKGAGCTRGTFIKTIIKPQNSQDRIVIPENQNLYIKITNSCGDTTVECYDYPTDAFFKMFWIPVQTGCANIANPNGLINLGFHYSDFGKFPISFTVEKLNGTVVRSATDSSIFHNLAYDTYIVVGQDACGLITRDTVPPPSVGQAVIFDDWLTNGCTNQTGTLTYNAFVKGYVNDLEHAVITITSGPSNVGVQAIYNAQLGTVQWVNMLPGNYTANIVTACGNTSVSFSVIGDVDLILVQNLTVTTLQACNNGGVINAVLDYNGSGTTSFALYNSANTVIANSASGNFTNVAAGNYIVKAIVQLYEPCLSTYTIDKPVTILPDGSAPQVNKKIVMICEDAGGNPTANGKAIIRSLGFAPFKVEAKKVSEPDANYIVKFASSVNDFTVDNLLPYENYRIRITDQCGNTALTDLMVGVLEQLNAVDNGTPCLNRSYTLSAPDMIDATYTWRKGSTIVATSREILFPNYDASNDGTYTCTISIAGGCVTRTVNNSLSGVSCTVLPIIIESFSATATNCNAQLSWKLMGTAGFAKVNVERSSNGIDFSAVNNTVINTINGVTQHFLDAGIKNGTNYYRLIVTEADGRKLQSKAVSVKNNCNEGKISLNIYPNPILKGTDAKLDIVSDVIGGAELRLINNMGQVIYTKTIITTVGSNIIKIPSANIPIGINIVAITLANKQLLTQKIIKE